MTTNPTSTRPTIEQTGLTDADLSEIERLRAMAVKAVAYGDVLQSFSINRWRAVMDQHGAELIALAREALETREHAREADRA